MAERKMRSVIFSKGESMLIENDSIKQIKNKNGTEFIAFWSPNENDTLKNNFFKLNELKLYKSDPSIEKVKGFYYCKIKENAIKKKNVRLSVLKKKRLENCSNQDRVANALKFGLNDEQSKTASTIFNQNHTNSKTSNERSTTNWEEKYWNQKKKNLQLKNKIRLIKRDNKPKFHESPNLDDANYDEKKLSEMLNNKNYEIVSKIWFHFKKSE